MQISLKSDKKHKKSRAAGNRIGEHEMKGFPFPENTGKNRWHNQTIQKSGNNDGVVIQRQPTFEKNDKFIIVEPCNIYDNHPGYLKRVEQRIKKTVYKTYAMAIGTPVAILDYQDNYYQVDCGYRKGWIKQKAIEGKEGSAHTIKAGFSTTSVRPYYNAIEIITSKAKTIINYLKNFKSEKGKQVAKEALIQGVSNTVGLVLLPIPGVSSLTSAAVRELLPKTKQEEKLEYANQFKSKSKSIYLAFVQKLINYKGNKQAGESTVRAVIDAFINAYSGIEEQLEKENKYQWKDDMKEQVLNTMERQWIPLIEEFCDLVCVSDIESQLYETGEEIDENESEVESMFQENIKEDANLGAISKPKYQKLYETHEYPSMSSLNKQKGSID